MKTILLYRLYVLFILVLWVICPYASRAQDGECGTVLSPEQIRRLNETKDARQMASQNGMLPRSLNLVPIKAHIVRKSDGTGGLTELELNDAIDTMNTYYANANINFFLCGPIHYIDDDTYYDFDASEESDLCDPNDQANVINIYFCNTVTSGGNNVCGYAYFPADDLDRVLMANSCATNGSTLSHEIGHYFSLLHTHETALGTETVTRNGLDPCYNCIDTGDRLCDTEADPNLDGQVDVTCNYTGGAQDGCDVNYTPPVSNIMSYSNKTCRDEFTEGQYSLIALSLQNDRDYLQCCSAFEPYELINDAIWGNDTRQAYHIDAQNVIHPGADVIYKGGNLIKLLPGFHAQNGSSFHAYILGCNDDNNDAMQDDWWLKDNENGTALPSPEDLVEVYPNPFTGKINIRYIVDQSCLVNLVIYDSYNQAVANIIVNQHQEKGKYDIVFDGTKLPRGIYYYRLSIGDQFTTGKLMKK